jgi:hypothetical protein
MLRKARHNVRQPLVTLLGTVAASTLCLGLAAAPARAGELDRHQWVRAVTKSLHEQIRPSPAVPVAVRMQKAAIVGAHFDGEGQLLATSLDVPTGNRVLDDEALRAVNHTAFPRLPAEMRGRVRMIPVEIFFATPQANRNRASVRRQSLDLAASVRQLHAEVPAGQPIG